MRPQEVKNLISVYVVGKDAHSMDDLVVSVQRGKLVFLDGNEMATEERLQCRFCHMRLAK